MKRVTKRVMYEVGHNTYDGWLFHGRQFTLEDAEKHKDHLVRDNPRTDFKITKIEITEKRTVIK